MTSAIERLRHPVRVNPVGNFGNETAKSLPVCKNKPEDLLSCGNSVKSDSLDPVEQCTGQIDDCHSCNCEVQEYRIRLIACFGPRPSFARAGFIFGKIELE